MGLPEEDCPKAISLKLQALAAHSRRNCLGTTFTVRVSTLGNRCYAYNCRVGAPQLDGRELLERNQEPSWRSCYLRCKLPGHYLGSTDRRLFGRPGNPKQVVGRGVRCFRQEARRISVCFEGL